jgi:hypothetical protein
MKAKDSSRLAIRGETSVLIPSEEELAELRK